jgi:hypothetical protein
MSDLSNAPTRELVEALISLLNGAIATSRAFRKSVTSSGACSVAVGPSNRARFAGARDRNNFMRIYETLY